MKQFFFFRFTQIISQENHTLIRDDGTKRKGLGGSESQKIFLRKVMF